MGKKKTGQKKTKRDKPSTNAERQLSRLKALPDNFFADEESSDYYYAARLLINDQHEAADPILTELEDMVKSGLGRRTGRENGDLEEGWNTETKKYEFKTPLDWEKTGANPLPLGRRTGKKNGDLEEGWNTKTKKYEFKLPKEWDRMKELEGPPPEGPPPRLLLGDWPPLGKPRMPIGPIDDPRKMLKLSVGDVHVHSQLWAAASEARLLIERKSISQMRANLTEEMNKRTETAKKSLDDNCAMAIALAGMLSGNDDLLKKGGLFFRIIGQTERQGQFSVADSMKIAETVIDAANRLRRNEGTNDDGNIVLQFMGCFTDGLTEVIEGKTVASDQFDEIWPKFQLNDKAKVELLERIEAYKQLAGAASDTLSGKSARKVETRKGFMPNDPRLQLEDTALIKNDISGSMHSCFLAQELAESLFSDGNQVKKKGEPVLLTNKELINSRVVDALAMTAGGKNGENDDVFHTAFEMINGMRGITGTPFISQAIATEIIDRMGKGKSFTDAIESIDQGVAFKWMAPQQPRNGNVNPPEN